MAECIPPSPSVDEFAESLAEVSTGWYTLGVFMGAPPHELSSIALRFSAEGVLRCLIELYQFLKSIGKMPSWEFIISSLKRMNKVYLADQINSRLVRSLRQSSVSSGDGVAARSSSTSTSEGDGSTDGVSTEDGTILKRERKDAKGGVEVPLEITREFRSLVEKFAMLNFNIKKAFEKSSVNLRDLQLLINSQCGLKPLIGRKATFETVFQRLESECFVFDFRILAFLVENFLPDEKIVQKKIENYEEAVNGFKSSAIMAHLIDLIKHEQTIEDDVDCQKVRLKVREFWKQFTLKQFERAMNELLGTLYSHVSQIFVERGCLCIKWIIPDIVKINIIPQHSKAFVKIIGVLSLHIGESVLCDFTDELGCEELEAAMIQAVQLKNTQAIELFLAMGCNPEVVTHNGDSAVTNIVNIKSGTTCGSVDHVCVLGHNEHVEAILDPSVHESDCSSCDMKDALIKQLHHEIDALRVSVKSKSAEIEEFTTTVKIKESEITLLKKENQSLLKEMTQKAKKLKDKLAEEKGAVSNSTAVIPRQRLGIGAEMRVKVITRDSSGKELTTGGATVKATLSCNKEECPVIDNGDGTYTVSVIPQQLGQHQLSITINGQHVQDSPFNITIVPRRDYSQLNQSVTTITGINHPMYIAFSDNGDMFVTSCGDHCIHVYDKSGNKKTTIGSEGSGQLQFRSPFGIDVNCELVYVAEYNGHRIHKLTTGGEFIGTIGEEGSDIGQFMYPDDVKISPDGKVYVADCDNGRVQVFNPDWTISHIINGRVSGDGTFYWPEGIAFDLSGNVHVTGYDSSSVSVFTPNGQFVRQYYKTHTTRPVGIAIDSSGYSLVMSYSNNTLSIFDPNGTFIHSVGGFNHPYGVSVSPDGSVWVADTLNNRLVQY